MSCDALQDHHANGQNKGPSVLRWGCCYNILLLLVGIGFGTSFVHRISKSRLRLSTVGAQRVRQVCVESQTDVMLTWKLLSRRKTVSFSLSPLNQSCIEGSSLQAAEGEALVCNVHGNEESTSTKCLAPHPRYSKHSSMQANYICVGPVGDTMCFMHELVRIL